MPRKKFRVIISDDNNQFRELFKESLTEKGVEVVASVSNGNEAVEKTLELKPDILFTDIVMDSVDGIEAIEKIKSNRYGKNVRICVISSLNSDDAIKQATRAGASYYFIKPVNIDRIISWAYNTFDVETYRLFEEKDNEAADIIITQLLHMFSIPPTINGFRYIKKGVMFVLQDPNLINHVIRDLYPKIASEFYSNPSCIERSIRHAICLAWSAGGFEKAKKEYAMEMYISDKKPTSSQFISFIASMVNERLKKRESNGRR